MSDSLFISPDLGWARVDLMLDPSENLLAKEIPWSELAASSVVPTGYIGLDTRVIDVNGTVRAMTLAHIQSLYGSGRYVYWRNTDSVVTDPQRVKYLDTPGEVQA